MNKPAFAPNHSLTLVTWSLLLSLLWSFQCRAENIFFPIISGPQSLKISNSSEEVQPIWILIKGQGFFKELIYRVPARGQLYLNEVDFLPTGLEYAIKTASPQVSASRHIENGIWIQGSTMTSPQVTYQVPGTPFGTPWPVAKLVLQNQNYNPQTFLVRFRDRSFRTLKEETAHSLGFFQTSTHLLNLPPETTSLEILGKGRLHSRIRIEKNTPQNGISYAGEWQEGRSFRRIEVPTPSTQTYFLLSNQSRSDSFVVALTDAVLIKGPKKFWRVIGYLCFLDKLKPLKKSWNRPFHGSDRTPWSWTVSKVTNFAEIGSIVCDSTPALVEEALPVWLRQQDICFWGFRLIRELSQEEVRWGRLQ
ncbi:MAG: hypothetical protein IPK04_21165 [Bdellovibrionales bacterium]|nr:hypothetical protein [Bdellovibrionales bacterium]